jgi:predicted enzyme involved in methoxymalonyl-ACP biosynthesis
MLDRAIDAARLAAVSRLVGVFRPTAKNGLVADLFDRLGFTRGEATSEETRYELRLDTVTGPYCTLIEHAGAEHVGDPR